MCTGAEIALIGTIASGAGTAVSTLGAIQQGKSAQNLANYNAQIAQNDAIAARQKAEFDALWPPQAVNCWTWATFGT